MIPFWTNGIVSSLVFLFILHVYVHLHLLNLHNENVMWNRLQSDNKLKFLLSKATSKPEATWIGIISIKLIFSDIMHKKFILERHILGSSNTSSNLELVYVFYSFFYDSLEFWNDCHVVLFSLTKGMWESDGCEKGSIVGSEILQKKKRRKWRGWKKNALGSNMREWRRVMGEKSGGSSCLGDVTKNEPRSWRRKGGHCNYN